MGLFDSIWKGFSICFASKNCKDSRPEDIWMGKPCCCSFSKCYGPIDGGGGGGG